VEQYYDYGEQSDKRAISKSEVFGVFYPKPDEQEKKRKGIGKTIEAHVEIEVVNEWKDQKRKYRGLRFDGTKSISCKNRQHDYI